MANPVTVAFDPLDYSHAVARSDLPTPTRALLWALATVYGHPTPHQRWASYAELAAWTGLSRRACMRHGRVAEQFGWLKVERQGGETNLYTLTVPVQA